MSMKNVSSFLLTLLMAFGLAFHVPTGVATAGRKGGAASTEINATGVSKTAPADDLIAPTHDPRDFLICCPGHLLRKGGGA